MSCHVYRNTFMEACTEVITLLRATTNILVNGSISTTGQCRVQVPRMLSLLEPTYCSIVEEIDY